MVPPQNTEVLAALDGRLLALLQQLLAMPALQLREALDDLAERLAETLGCAKVDAFLLDDSRNSLVAGGTSPTPMGRRQKELGLDFLPIVNGGAAVQTWLQGESRRIDRSDRDPEELRAIIQELGVRSSALVPILVNGERRGVLSAVDSKPSFFTDADLRFLEIVAQWVGAIAHRAELVDAMQRAESERARRAAADEIVTVLAHDFRNHLNPLLGRLHLMRLKVAGGATVNVDEVDSAVRSVQRLSRLTSDLLDVGRLDHGLFTLTVAPVDLLELVNETSRALAAPKRTVDIQAGVPAPFVVIADAERLRQALENVLANAIQHSPPGSAVCISIQTRGEGDAHCAIVEIVDRGPGIPPDLMPKIFERFASGRGSQGLGLGLYLAAEIARAHGGELTVESTIGRGSRFRFELPLAAAAHS